MKKGRDSVYFFQDIHKACESISKFIYEYGFEDFKQDEKTIFAVIRALEIIGEASKKIPKQIKELFQEINWKEMAQMRDKLIHDYTGVDIDIVYETCKKDIPVLQQRIKKALEILLDS